MKTYTLRLLTLGLVAAACIYTYRLEAPETHTYAAAGISRTRLTTQNGDVSVSAVADTVITVNVKKYAYGRDHEDAEKALDNVIYTDTIAGDELRVKEQMPSGSRPYGANLAVTGPESLGLSLSTTNGDIAVEAMVGSVDATTSNGDVTLTGTTGTASVSTTNGRLAVSVHSGPVYGATTNGAIDCDLAVLGAAEDAGLATTNGKVTLLLPEDVSAVIDATNSGGVITIHDYTVTYETQTEHHIHARIGSGASTITITTTNGDITIRRRS